MDLPGFETVTFCVVGRNANNQKEDQLFYQTTKKLGSRLNQKAKKAHNSVCGPLLWKCIVNYFLPTLTVVNWRTFPAIQHIQRSKYILNYALWTLKFLFVTPIVQRSAMIINEPKISWNIEYNYDHNYQMETEVVGYVVYKIEKKERGW